MRRWKYRIFAVCSVLLAVLLLCPVRPLFAQVQAQAVDPIASAAFDVLDRHCARCHQEGRLVDRDRPAKNFGNILKLNEIAANPHYVLPGNALGSKLFRQIADREMPYDVMYEGDARYPHVSADDLQALERWIVSLGKRPAACTARTMVTPAATAVLIAADLDRMPAGRRSTARYLTLTHLANNCANPTAMKVFREGAIK